MLLGKVIETDLSYNSQEHLESIEYRSTDDRKLIEGFRYQYDDSGKKTHEIQLSGGSTYGERYYYDNANRATKAQYGVQDVFDPNSSFEQETSYEHFPEGSWKRRLDIDGRGQVISEKSGTINQLNKYRQFGDLSFQYDANGNCIRKGKPNPGFCLYTYDQDNKLIKVECYGADGVRTKKIEYFYDLLGRQVRKVVTDQNGTITEYTYVWAGKFLIEEYENGVLARTYFYGIGSIPVQLTVRQGGVTNYYYTFNGRGLASGLLPENNPNFFAEKYGYEVTGASFVKEIAGVNVEIPNRGTEVSSLVNSIISGSYLKDWANGSLSFIGGTHITPELSAILNGVDKEIGTTVRTGLEGAQGYLEALGLSSGRNGSTAVGAGGGSGQLPPGATNPNDQSLFGYVSSPGMNPPTAGPHRPVPEAFPGKKVENFLIQTSSKALLNWVVGPIGRVLYPNSTDPNEDARFQFQQQQWQQAREEEAAARAADAAPKAAAEARNDPPPSPPGDYPVPPQDTPVPARTDPDADSGGSQFEFPSARQVEAIFMRDKTPINPNYGGSVTPTIDIASMKFRRTNGFDPLVALFDEEIGITGGTVGTVLIGGGLVDPLNPDLAPELPGSEGSPPPGREPYPYTD
jgi:hypothetical protein